MRTKATFTYSGRDITVTQHHWGEHTDIKTQETCMKWLRRGPSRYYSLNSMSLAVVTALLDEFNCHRGESAEELLDLFNSIDRNLGRIADSAEAQQGLTVETEL